MLYKRVGGDVIDQIMSNKNNFNIIAIKPKEIWSLKEVKNYMRVEADYNDGLITSLIDTAIIAAENFTKIILKVENRELALDKEKCYLDHEQSILCFNENLEYNQLLVNYQSGFDRITIPKSIQHGILMHTLEMYDREEHNNIAMSIEIKNLYLPYRQLRI